MHRQIETEVSRLRAALDQVSPNTWLACMISNFPRGACGRVTEMVSRHLQSSLGIECSYASGDVEDLVDGFTHAWAEFSGLAIDITADQFEGLPSIIVSGNHWLHIGARNVVRHPIIQDDGWFGRYAAPAWNEAQQYLEG